MTRLYQIYLTFRFKRFQYLRIIHANQKWCLYVPGGWNRNRSDFGFLSLHHVNCYCLLLLFCIQEINRFLEIPIWESRKILRVSRNLKLEPRNSILDSRKHRGSRIEFRVETVNLLLPGTVGFLDNLNNNVSSHPLPPLQWVARSQW